MTKMYKTLAICFSLMFLFAKCKTDSDIENYKEIVGLTMGGITYTVIAPLKDPDGTKAEIEVLLKEVNDGMNTYVPNSLISQFNNSESGGTYDLTTAEAQHFYKNIAACRRIVKETNNHFDPTVGPLVNYWRFGPDGKYNLTAIDSTKVDSLMNVVSFNRIILKKDQTSFQIDKSDSRVELDFSAIAKGYAVDEIASLLESQGIDDYFVDIGGETRLKGLSDKDIPWIIGISTPLKEASARDIFKIIHDECMYADAYATACMVMGLEKALQFVNTHPEISYLFLYSDKKGEIESVSSGDIDFM